MTNNFHMGTNYLLKVITGKWKVSIICALGLRDYRYLELLKYENDVNHTKISKKVLTEQLNQLEEDGIITKKSYGTIPPKVVYSLTTIGQELAKNLTNLNFLGEKLAQVNQANISFDINAQQVKNLHKEEQD
ncbi:helix-turn-helix transcriptional regulator [Limosilactobacillus sp. WF-MT5-A]|uniref:winged helix-turn-helix transcriptional regulator n=1 Tax=Limosilactobacillus agrestis TaxID=2759748 RepID=UPI0015F92620|nr:helix-turn-helix domain-containing protein [Limosilactobacillus agrestis]MBB1099607.1 helix-turn-helix transcriptional regulator [Limosilactobacillus agrestis]MCD7119919.1 helix-turn-helix transcriptional regulator [Limosilactobacillus agrestis]MCD7127239.1 helix-turn-helix transcriptional regulator [Limosilactobacillus agrestis]